MTSQNLNDKMAGFKPLGYDLPVQEKKYQKPDKKVAQMFEDWLDMVAGGSKNISEVYNATFWAMQYLDISVLQAHALIQEYKDHPHISKAGIFLSALYNRSSDSIFVFDVPLEKPIDFPALNLVANNTFVNRELVNAAGDNAHGTLINYGTARGFGKKSDGCVVNYGLMSCHTSAVDPYVFLDEASSLSINLGKMVSSGYFFINGFFINYGEIDIPGYLSGGTHAFFVNCGKVFSRSDTFRPNKIICVNNYSGYEAVYGQTVLQPNDCKRIPCLCEYFEGLRCKLEEGRIDVNKAIKVANSLSRQQIEKDLECIITAGGYKW